MPTNTQPVRVSRKPSSKDVDNLTEKLATGLTISKGKQKAPALSPDEEKLAAMRAVNTASQTLGKAVQSGWKQVKGGAAKKSETEKNVVAATGVASSSLVRLRVLCPDDLDIERAAVNVLGKLVSLEMFDDAVTSLRQCHPSLCRHLGQPEPPKESSQPGNLYLLSLSMVATENLSPILLTIISSYLSSALTILTSIISRPQSALPRPAKAQTPWVSFVDTLTNHHTLIDWMPSLAPLTQKHLDPILTRAYSLLTKTTSTLAPSSDAEARALYLIRIYGLFCLAYTSKGIIEKPDTFWAQASKFSHTYVKTCSSSSEVTISTVVGQSFSKLVGYAKARDDPQFLSGKGFVRFCENWTGFASKLGNAALLDEIVVLMSGGSVPSVSGGQIPKSDPGPTLSEDESLREVAKLTASFAKMTSLLDQSEQEVELISNVLSLLDNPHITTVLGSSNQSANDSFKHACAKLERSLERLRKAIGQKYERNGTISSSGFAQILESVVGHLERIVQTNPQPTFYTQVLDTLFILAQGALQVDNPVTHSTCHNYLSRAKHLLSTKEGNIPGRANYIRCLSGVFHNTAGKFYQAKRYASAIPFADESCTLGRLALSLSKAQGNDDENVEGWAHLQEQLYRRWQLLSACHSKIGDRQESFSALKEAAIDFPYEKSGFLTSCTSLGQSALFESSPALKELTNIIHRYSTLAACDLLLPCSGLSLKDVGLSSIITGALVEQQYESLWSLRRKPAIQSILSELLTDALELYTASEMPVRRARVLVQCLAFGYYIDPNQIQLGGPSEIGKIIEGLLARQDFGRDSGLVKFVEQYRAATHLWLSLHAHRSQDPDQTVLIGQHANEAISILQVYFNPPNTKSPPVKDLAKKPAPRRTANKKLSPKPPVTTPRKRSPKALEEVALVAPLREKAKNLKIDNPDSLAGLLSVLAHILGLLSLHLPKIRCIMLTRTIHEQHQGILSDGYINATSDLAHEYLVMGKTQMAESLFLPSLSIIQDGTVSPDAGVPFLLKYALFLAGTGNLPESHRMYRSAAELATRCLQDDTGSSWQRMLSRVHHLERVAMACQVGSAIQYYQDDLTGSIEALLQALRLWNYAVDTISRFQAPIVQEVQAEENPFAATPKESQPSSNSFPRRSSMEAIEWKISQGLLATMLSLCDAYSSRGSVREAEYFAEQAMKLAISINAPVMCGRALVKTSQLQLHRGFLDEAQKTLVEACRVLQDMPGVDSAEVLRINGELKERIAEYEDAQDQFEQSKQTLDDLNKLYDMSEQTDPDLRKSLALRSTSESVFPEHLAVVLRQYAWLLRDDSGKRFSQLLDLFSTLQETLRTKAEENLLNAKLCLHTVYKRFKADIYFSSIAESTICLPIGSKGAEIPDLPPASREVLRNLDESEDLFWADLEICYRRAEASRARDSIISLGMIQAFKTSLGAAEDLGPSLVANLLDSASAITLRRELLEAIGNKHVQRSTQDDFKWPGIDIALETLGLESKRSLFIQPNLTPLKPFWSNVSSEYQSQSFNPERFAASKLQSLPKSWTIVHISVTFDQSTLFISRQRGGEEQQPLVFCIPLKGRREGSGDEDEHLTFEDAISELSEIIHSSNETTKVAVNIKDQAARAEWWKQRKTLDTRLHDLLENIEFCWLGAFKTILSAPSGHSPETIEVLRLAFDRVFQQGLHLQDKKTKQKALGHRKASSSVHVPNRVTMDDALLECFSNLSPTCRDEELEDIIYFTLDLYQFHGVPVAIAEIDIIQMVVDLRSVLEEHGERLSRAKTSSTPRPDDEHLFLVLDKNVQGLPWESIPTLRGRSVSRVPSVDFLLDRVGLAKHIASSESERIDRFPIDPKKGYYILNPSGDLRKTEDRFKSWAEGMESLGWQGVTGREPSEQQFAQALETKDLVIYFGHGGGEQYIRSSKIRGLPRCAALMLWGCSSGALRDMGDFDRVGTPFNYMLAGCPSLVCNLWDVTDRDIDTFSQAVFDKLHLNAASIKGEDKRKGRELSIAAAIGQSREACKLKYLTGAAPVVYGIPFYL